ncbi:MAG: TonB-dependent siderophore receptor [Colwellia sp.]|nr:TonB-dependent siderophore receptor [Colwellia sp.]MCW8863932.1 TonB-dependent siderophore receptor [Colwellia sp.]MCW9082196.1 TonB-dependent siderophore receptor [Colwellia sp.]
MHNSSLLPISCVLLFTFTPSLQAETIDDSRLIEVIEVVAKTSKDNNYINNKTVDNISEFLAVNIDKIEDVVAYTPSVFASTTNAGMETGLSIRGFSTGRKNIYVNGHLDNQRMFMRSPETVEQVSIVKGHSSIFYGGAAPGGTLIYHTKKPQSEAQTKLTATLGSFDKYKLALDTSGNITNSLDYRAVLVKQQANSFIENAKDDKETFYAHLGWELSAKQQLAFEVEYNQLTNPWTFGIVRIDDNILYDKSYVYPATDSNRDYLRSSIYWHYLLGENSKLTVKLNQVDLDRDDVWMGFYYKLANENLLGYWADIENEAKQHNAVIDFEHTFKTSWASHNFHLGYNYNQYENGQHMDRSIGTFIIDPYAPDYSIAEPTVINSVRDFSSDETESSFYLLDSMEFNQYFQLSLGLRGSAFKIIDRTNNKVSVDKKAVTSFLGAAYQINDDIRLYSNFSQSFEPNIGLDRNQQYFDPKKANQIELAVEYAFNQQHNLSAAIYQITQSNLLTRDPVDPDFKILAGNIESKGLEVTLTNNIAQQWQLETSFSHIKNELDNTLSPHHGNSTANIPRNSFSSQLNWQHPNNSVGMHIGMFGLSSRYGNNANSFTLPGYVRVDLGGYVNLDAWQFSLNIENLFDKRYIVTSNYEDDMYPGRTRDVRLTASYQW